MNRTRALIVSLAVAVAAVAGVFAATSTISLGSEAQASTDKQVARRAAQLDRYEASLRRTLAKQPPKLPAAPTGAAASTGVPSTAPARVVYRRAVPVVVAQHAGSDEAYEHEDEDEEYEHAGDRGDEDKDGRESDD